MVGISCKSAPVQSQGYVPLLGNDDESWGWNLVDNLLLHNGDGRGTYPLVNNLPSYQACASPNVNLQIKSLFVIVFIVISLRFFCVIKKLTPNNKPITSRMNFITQVELLILFQQIGERIRVILDCDDNTLAFEKNYEFLGWFC